MNLERITQEYIDYVGSLYNSIYDDRIEDCHPPTAGEDLREPGRDWIPGQVADHKSIIAFQRELQDMGIKLSSSKIRKILITGGCWTTERSREIQALYNEYTRPTEEGGLGLKNDTAVQKIAEKLGVSFVTVSVNLPYQDVVYSLDNKSSNAKRCDRYRERKSKGLTRLFPKN